MLVLLFALGCSCELDLCDGSVRCFESTLWLVLLKFQWNGWAEELRTTKNRVQSSTMHFDLFRIYNVILLDYISVVQLPTIVSCYVILTALSFLQWNFSLVWWLSSKDHYVVLKWLMFWQQSDIIQGIKYQWAAELWRAFWLVAHIRDMILPWVPSHCITQIKALVWF